MRPAVRLILLAVLGFGGLLTPLGILSVAVVWFLMAERMPGRTQTRQLAYAAITLFALTASVLTVLALVDVRCSPRLLAGSYLVALVVIAGRWPASRPEHLADRQDAWSLGLAGLTAAFLSLPLLGSSPGQVMTLLSQTTDGGTHVQMVIGVARHGGYLTFHPLVGMRDGIEHYPSGWAGNVWILSTLVKGGMLTPVGTVRFVAFTVAVSYGLLTFAACRLALALAHRLRDDVGVRDEALVTALVALSTTAGFALFFVNLNSFTQVVAIAALLLAILLMCERDQTLRGYVVLGATVVTLAQTWYLIAPMLGGVAVVAVARAGARRARLLPLGVVVGLLAAFPVVTGPSGHQVSARGAQLLPTLLGVLGLLVVGGVAVLRLAARGGTRDNGRLAWTSAFVAALALECVLLPFRPADVPGTSYYAGKVLLVLFLLAAVAGAGAVVGHTSTRSLGSLAVVAGLLAAAWTTRSYALPPGLGHVKHQVRSGDIDALMTRHPTGLPPDVDAWILDGCSRVGDLIASKWMYDLSLTWTDARSTAIEDYVYDKGKRVNMLASRAAEPGVRSIEVVVGRNCQPDNVAELTKNPKVTIIRVP